MLGHLNHLPYLFCNEILFKLSMVCAFELYHKFSFQSSVCVLISVYYASGTSIAKFPSSGTLITKTLKDQGSVLPQTSHYS